MSKSDVTSWETVADFTCDSCDDTDPVSVEVQVGTDGSEWFLRSRTDDEATDDELSDTGYLSREEAVEAAEEFAEENEEAGVIIIQY